jgi:GNAT superfamily N-acetyltransferase
MRFTRDDVDIRFAVEADRNDIERIASQTWDGRDYLPRVFDQWLDDEEGTFNVMTYQGQVIALGKLSKLGEDEWWVEGLRVDPDFRGQGLGRIMHHYLVAQARQMANGVLRFATSGSNHAVVKFALETGFQLVGQFVPYEAPVQPDAPISWWPLTIDDLPRLQAWLEDSDYFEVSQRSFEHRWKWFMANETYLAEQLEAGFVYGWNPEGNANGALLGVLAVSPLRQDSHDEEPIQSFAFVDALPEMRSDLWQAARGLAATLGGKIARVKMVDNATYTVPLVKAGWQAKDWQPVLFYRPLSMVSENQVRYEEIPALSE